MWVISIVAEIGPITPLSNAAITQRRMKKEEKREKESLGEKKKKNEREREREEEGDGRRENGKGGKEQKAN